MKRLLSLILATCLLLACVMAFSSCGGTKGLEFQQYGREGYSVSVGAAWGREHIVIPAKYDGKPVVAIDDFSGCTSLKSIKIPNSVKHIGYSAFSGCCSLESIVIPEGVTFINEYAFFDCTSLESITIPSSVTSIGSGAFYGCTGLTSITIPSSVTYIDNNAFADCTGLTSVTFENTEGWKVMYTNDIFRSSDLANPYVAADYLTNSYAGNDWTRK